MTTLPFLTADDIFERMNYLDAVRTLQRDLRSGLDPDADFERGSVDLAQGKFLLMPSESSEFAGVKVLTVAAENPARGLPLIQGVYVLTDAATLSPVALLDGAALTTLRTPAVSAAAADLLVPDDVPRLVVFGSGPQALGHVEAMRSIRRLEHVTIVARNQERAASAAAAVRASGIVADVGTVEAIRDADVIVCATTATEPLFDSALVPDTACVLAVGAHAADAREVDSALVARSQVVVESVPVALREAGDVMIPVAEGRLSPDALTGMRDLVTGAVPVDWSRPRIFKSTGMSWEDLSIASELYRRG
ncbi:ornithine cyclodeaminase family protein [Cryobacterium sp. BB736]|uniref:ornithine cyclodeaminase family protein n=1 Tax=Cryobacterium sp. BB736 TaxID=2746963 RepID=UPI0018757556|nr:ornithine cyclodeaminase family protein [Cryobacterium sp. BB736]